MWGWGTKETGKIPMSSYPKAVSRGEEDIFFLLMEKNTKNIVSQKCWCVHQSLSSKFHSVKW